MHHESHPSAKRLSVAGPAAPLEQVDVPWGEHLCLVYDRTGEPLPAAAAFLATGLRRGARCAYVADDHTIEQVVRALEAAGVNVGREQARGALILADAAEYGGAHPFDPARMCERLRDLVEEALGADLAGLRLAVEMTWTLTQGIDPERLIEYEAMTNALVFARGHIAAICMYNRSRFPAATIEHVLAAHPAVASGAASPGGRPWPHRQTSPRTSDRMDNSASDRMNGMHAEDARIERAVRERMAQEESRSAQRLAFLAEAGRVLSSSLDYETTLRSFARLTTPTVADYCIIDLVEEDGSIRRVATAHRDPAREELTAALRGFPPDPLLSDGVPKVLLTGESLILPEVEDAVLRAGTRGEEHLRIVRDLGPRSLLIVPLNARNRTLGAITLVYTDSGRQYGTSDLTLAEELAGHAALALDNARLHRDAQAEIGERKRAQEELDRQHTFLQLLLEVTTAANEASSFRETLRIALDRIRAHTHWPIGHAWLPTSEGHLRSTDLWSTDDPERFQALREVTKGIALPPGIGLPGRVLATGQVVGVADVTTDPSFLRAQMVSDLGVKAAFAIPVLVGREVAAVLEFFSGRPVEPDAEFLDVMAHVGAQLGRVVERERAREAVRASEERWRATFEHAPIGITMVDRARRFSRVNEQFCRFLGYARDELIGRSIEDVTHPGDVAEDLAQFERLFAGEIGAYAMEKRYRRKDGSIAWGHLAVAMVRDGAGEPLYQLGSIADITDRKRAEAALQESEERFREIAENIHEVFWVSDPRLTRLLYVSPAYEEVWGRPREPLYEDPLAWMETIHPEDHARVKAAGPSRIRGEYEIEYRIIRPDGEVRWIYDRGFPVRNDAGEVSRIVGIAEDVTEDRQLQEERARLLRLEHEAREQAEDAVHTRDEVLRMAAHDLKNPIHTIKLSAALLADVPLPEEQRAHQIRVISRTATHMERLVGGLLDLKRIEAGHGIPIEPRPTEVRTLLAQSHSLFAAQAEAKKVEIIREMPEDGPAVHADPDRVLQVLWNLTGNAIKFTPEGGRVIIRAEQQTAEVLFSVSDTGPGIAPEAQARLFDPFWQEKRTARLGTGLGLPISKAIVEAHDGRIWIASTPGAGTTFYFTLPIA